MGRDDEFVAPPPRERVTSGEVLLTQKVDYGTRERIKMIALRRQMSVKDLILQAIETQVRVWKEEEGLETVDEDGDGLE